MSSAEAQLAYQRPHAFSEPMEAQHNFAQQYDLANPDEAMFSYKK